MKNRSNPSTSDAPQLGAQLRGIGAFAAAAVIFLLCSGRPVSAHASVARTAPPANAGATRAFVYETGRRVNVPL
ncbi:MAG: hypothetical protein ACRD4Y_18170, partial [Candidatus Acidiferrales bacterium]